MLSYDTETSKNDPKLDNTYRAMREVWGFTRKVKPANPADFHMTIRCVPLGQMRLTHVNFSSKAHVSSGNYRPDDNLPCPYHIFINNRRHQVLTETTSTVLEPGDVTLTNPSCATSMDTYSPSQSIGLSVPASVLRKYVPVPEQAIGVRFSGENGLSRIVSQMLVSMWQLAESGALASVGNKLAINMLEVFSVCCYLDKPEIYHSDNSHARLAQIKQLIDDSLNNFDSEVGIKELADKLGLSTRYIQMLFAKDNNTVSKYIRNRRLDACRRQLADPAWLSRSITEIAFNWGFNSSAYFSRVFREQYGVCPREFRAQAVKGLAYYKDTGTGEEPNY